MVSLATSGAASDPSARGNENLAAIFTEDPPTPRCVGVPKLSSSDARKVPNRAARRVGPVAARAFRIFSAGGHHAHELVQHPGLPRDHALGPGGASSGASPGSAISARTMMTLRQSSITVSASPRRRIPSAIFRLRLLPARSSRACARISGRAPSSTSSTRSTWAAEPSFSRSDSFVTPYNVHDERVARAQVEGNARLLLLLLLLLRRRRRRASRPLRKRSPRAAASRSRRRGRPGVRGRARHPGAAESAPCRPTRASRWPPPRRPVARRRAKPRRAAKSVSLTTAGTKNRMSSVSGAVPSTPSGSTPPEAGLSVTADAEPRALAKTSNASRTRRRRCDFLMLHRATKRQSARRASTRFADSLRRVSRNRPFRHRAVHKFRSALPSRTAETRHHDWIRLPRFPARIRSVLWYAARGTRRRRRAAPRAARRVPLGRRRGRRRRGVPQLERLVRLRRQDTRHVQGFVDFLTAPGRHCPSDAPSSTSMASSVASWSYLESGPAPRSARPFPLHAGDAKVAAAAARSNRRSPATPAGPPPSLSLSPSRSRSQASGRGVAVRSRALHGHPRRVFRVVRVGAGRRRRR